VSPQSLSDAELERVREILDRFGDKRAMNLEQIDGFLAALVCGPDDIPLVTIGRMGSCVGWTCANNLGLHFWTTTRMEGVVPVFALAYEHDPDPEMRSYDKPASPELREKLRLQ
jgi:hypothetical protein